MVLPGAPEAPEEPEQAADTVAARSVSAPLTAANSNAGRVPRAPPTAVKGDAALWLLAAYRGQSCRARFAVSAPSRSRPGTLQMALPNAPARRHSSPRRN